MDNYATFQYTSNLEICVGYLRQETEMGNGLQVQMDQYQQIIVSHYQFLKVDRNGDKYGEPYRIQFVW